MKPTLRSTVGAASLCLVSVAFAADQGQPAPTVDVKQLPAPVQATLQSEGARVSKVEQQTEGGTTSYEAILSKDGKNYSLHLGADGKIIKREAIADEQKTK